jgi:hypothetical protein
MRLALVGLLAAIAATYAASSGASRPAFRVSLERTVCFGTCPIYTVSVRGDGTTAFVGRRFVAATGERRARLSRSRVADLRAAVTRARVFTLRDRYDKMLVTDLPSVKLTFRVGSRTKRIYHYLGDRSAPERLRRLECQIDRLARTSRWVGKPTSSYCATSVG